MNKARIWLVLGSLIGILTLALAACGNDSGVSPSDASSTQSRPSDGPIANDFTVSTGPDSSFSLSEHRGEIVVLYFSFPG